MDPLSRLLRWGRVVVPLVLPCILLACAESTDGEPPVGGTPDASASDADAASDSDSDDGDGNGCGMTSCAQEGAECGSIPDGCGDSMECGTCPDGQTCGAAGPNQCGVGTCDPSTCSQLGASCGVMSDGCAEVLDCGTCTPPDTCGGGGNPNECGCTCDRSHATTDCTAGECSIQSCDADWEDCDADETNGCEVDITSSADHCGACGNACTASHAATSCVSSACNIGACEAGYDDCDNDDANGCETNIRSDPQNCGACGNPCPAPGGAAICTNSVCGLSNCAPGRGDCDGNQATGCETNTDTSIIHCGFCDNPCSYPNASAVCSGGACAIGSCDAGWGDCDGNPANGCETNTNASLEHCGACSAACSLPNATEVCSVGDCTISACAPDWEDCDGVASNGCEADVNDPNVCSPGTVRDVVCPDCGNDRETCTPSCEWQSIYGTPCTGLNLCATQNGYCDAHASCTDIPGGGCSCACFTGWTGDGKTCDCTPQAGSPTPTPTIDEDCDGTVDNTVTERKWVVTSTTPYHVNSNGCAYTLLGSVGATCTTLGCAYSHCGVNASNDIFSICTGSGHGGGNFIGDATCQDVTLYY